MYYIGTKSQCEDYDAMVTSKEIYRQSTENWSTPIKVGLLWYVKKHENHEMELEAVESLPVINELI